MAKVEVLIGDASGTRAPSDYSLNATLDDIQIGGEDLRRLIGEIIGRFFVTDPPVEPSMTALLSAYLIEECEDFRQVRDDIVGLVVDFNAAKPNSQEHKALVAKDSQLNSIRGDILAKVIVSAEFRRHMALAKSRYNDERQAYIDLSECIEQLKPFLGWPRLLAISVPSIEPFVILNAIKATAEALPCPDQMVMMGEEPFSRYPQFCARAIYYNGINPSLARSHVFIPFSRESKEGIEAFAEGAIAKAGRFAFKIRDNRPVSVSDWRKIDSLLPFAARSLTIPLVPLLIPSSALMVDLKLLFGVQWWNAYHAELLKRNAEVCQLCGSILSVEAIPSWRFIEPPMETTVPGVMILDSFYLMCGDCRFAFRPSLEKSFKTLHGRKVAESDLIERINLVNRWTELSTTGFAAQVFDLMIASFTRRSSLRWLVNLSLLSDQPLRLNPSFVIDDNGWIIKEGAKHDLFKIIGASFYDREFNRRLFPALKIFRTKWGFNLAEATKFVHDRTDDVIVEDANGVRVHQLTEVDVDDDESEVKTLTESPTDGGEPSQFELEDSFGRGPVDPREKLDDDFSKEDEEEIDPETAEMNRNMMGDEITF